MIQNKSDLKYYLLCDKVSLRIEKKRPSLCFMGAQELIWKFEILMRKLEYYSNCTSNKFFIMLYKYRYSRMGIKLGFSIPINTFGPGLSISHIGTILINSNSKVGKNCRIQTGVTLGATNGSNDSPQLGDNVFLGDGCKLIGNIRVADGVAIGANAVVVSSIEESNTTWGGIPAKKISNNSSKANVIYATDIVERRLNNER